MTGRARILVLLGIATAALATLAGTALAAAPLDSSERATLLQLREEEKLAHDVYVVLAAKTGDRRFVRIAAAETRHAAALERALAAYGIADPTDGLAPGVFPTPAVQRLYDELVARGSASTAAALAVGREIEQHDLVDLKAALAATDEPLLDRVYANLLAASERHLAAFDVDRGSAAPRLGSGRGGPRWR